MGIRGGSTARYEIYGYDEPHNRPGLLASVDRPDPVTTVLKRDAFTYDLLPELTNAQYGLVQTGQNWGTPQRTCDYDFDKAGNRKTMTDSIGPSHNYGTPTVLNQYLTDGTNPITPGSQHEMANYQNVAYKYINDTHLSQVSGMDLSGNQSTYQLSYDALGRCAVRILNGVTTSYIYDGEKAILEYHSWSAPSAKNLYGKSIDEILMRTDPTVNNGQPFYYQDDHEGSVTHLTDANGNVLERYTYDAFGKPTIYNSTSQQLNFSTLKNRFMFTGREYVEAFGIYEYRNRAYHPGLGRFMSEDPKGFDAGDNNFFRYVGNDPLDRVDPMGLDGDPVRPTANPMMRQDYTSASDRIEREQLADQSTIAGQNAWKALHVEPQKAGESGLRVGLISQDTKERLVLGGNATDPMDSPSHYTDEKLRNEKGPAAGLTTAELVPNKDGTVTVKVDLRVRRELAAKDRTLLPREWQHVDRWKSWIERMNKPGSDVSKAFARSPWNEATSNAIRAFLGPYRRNEIIKQNWDFHQRGGPHDIDYHLKD